MTYAGHHVIYQHMYLAEMGLYTKSLANIRKPMWDGSIAPVPHNMAWTSVANISLVPQTSILPHSSNAHAPLLCSCSFPLRNAKISGLRQKATRSLCAIPYEFRSPSSRGVSCCLSCSTRAIHAVAVKLLTQIRIGDGLAMAMTICSGPSCENGLRGARPSSARLRRFWGNREAKSGRKGHEGPRGPGGPEFGFAEVWLFGVIQRSKAGPLVCGTVDMGETQVQSSLPEVCAYDLAFYHHYPDVRD